MNQNNNTMTLELTIFEVTQLKSLIFDEVDKVGGLDQLDPLLYDILVKISTEKAPKALQTKGFLVIPTIH